MDRINLVTGASGYIGSWMVKFLLEKGEYVKAMVTSEKKKNLVPDGAEIVVGDLRDKESLKKAVKNVTHIYNIASLFKKVSCPDSVFYDVNCEGVRRLFETAISEGVKRIVHCSTGGVLGDIENPPGKEDSPYNPGDIYQITKMEGEKIALNYFKSGKIKGVVIRPAMVYGPGDRRNFKIFKMLAKGWFFYIGKGDKYVHFVDVRDLVKAFYLAMEKEHLNAEIYIIAGEKALPLKEAIKIICSKLNVKEPTLHLPVKPMQIIGSICEVICKPFGIPPPIFRRRVDFFTKNRYFEWSKAARELGYKPSKTFEEEVADIITWYKEHNWL